MSDVWSFRCYVDTRDVDVIEAWYEAQQPGLQAKFDERIRHLKQQPRDKWNRPHFDTLSGGECAGLGELRLPFKGVQHRLLGAATGDHEYTWLFTAKEVGGKFQPKDACSKAQVRLVEVSMDKDRARACDDN